jgi:hypothetical protein
MSVEDPNRTTAPDPGLVLAVRRALKNLSATHREIVEARLYDCLTFSQIALRLNMTERNARASYYAARQALKLSLAHFVEKRWQVKPDGICRICTHPRRVQIEKLLSQKTQSETWSAFGRKLEREIGEIIKPPKILIAHQMHIGAKS